MGLPPKSDANGARNGQTGPTEVQVEIRVLNQYIKDLSFENPNMGKQMLAQGENPNLQVEVNVNANRMAQDVYESAILLKGLCNSKAGKLYEFECEYAGLFEVKNMPDQALEQFLLVNSPALLFPFLRRIAADMTREGGFPPLLLDPIDFASLYLRRREQEAAQGGAPVAQA
jgi:preprotein translocase subunit SecB